MRFAYKLQQVFKLGFRLARKTGDKGATHHQFGAGFAPSGNALQVALATGRALHAFKDVGVAVLQRHVQIGQHFALCHQRQQFVHRGVGVNIVQAHPGAVRCGDLAQGFDQFKGAGFYRLAVPKTGAVLRVHAVGRGVLADDQQFFDAAFKKRARFIEYIADRARYQVSAHGGDDAKGAAVVTAFADLQVGVVARRELDAGYAKALRHQIDKRVVRLGQVQVHRIHDFLSGMRPGDGQHFGVHLADQIITVAVGASAQATSDDDASVVSQSFANGVQAFLYRIVNKAAGVDDDQVRTGKGFGGLVAFGAQLREYEFGVGQCFWAAQADKAHDGRARCARAVDGFNGHEVC